MQAGNAREKAIETEKREDKQDFLGREDCRSDEEDYEEQEVKNIMRQDSKSGFPSAVFTMGAVVNSITDAAGIAWDAINNDSFLVDDFDSLDGRTSSGEEIELCLSDDFSLNKDQVESNLGTSSYPGEQLANRAEF
jgi:hypothetical protein